MIKLSLHITNLQKRKLIIRSRVREINQLKRIEVIELVDLILQKEQNTFKN